MRRMGVALALRIAAAFTEPSHSDDLPENPREFVASTAAQAEQAFESGQVDEAFEIVLEAQRRWPLPVFTFMYGRLEERRGNCRAAMRSYRQYLATEPLEEDAKQALDGLARCSQAQAIVAEPVEPAPLPSEPSPPEQGPAEQGRRWWRDPAGGALVGTGGLAVVVGGGLLIGSEVARQAAENAPDLATHDEQARRAETLQPAGIITASVGGALVLAGIIRYSVLARRSRRSTVAAGPAGLAVRF